MKSHNSMLRQNGSPANLLANSILRIDLQKLPANSLVNSILRMEHEIIEWHDRVEQNEQPHSVACLIECAVSYAVG